MAVNNALLMMAARGGQPRVADAKARGYAQGNALAKMQREQERYNALAEAAPLLAQGGPGAAFESLANAGQFGPAMGIYAGERDYSIKRHNAYKPLSKYGKAQWDESRGLAPPGSAQAAIKSSGQPLTKVIIDQGKQWNKYTTDRYGSTREAAQSAQGMNSQLGQFRGLLDAGVKTGWGEPWKMQAKQAANAFGFDVDLQGVAGQEVLTSISNQVIAPLVKQLGSNPTDRDLAFITNSIPRLSASVEGNRLMLSAIEIANSRKIAEYNFAMQYMQQNGQAFQADPFGAQIQMDAAFEEYKAQNPEIFDGATQQLMQQFEQIGAAESEPQSAPEATRTYNGKVFEKHNGQWFERLQ